MKVLSTVEELRDWRHHQARARPKDRIGFVATMGALHDAHRSLMLLARKGTDRVVVSIFVNPLQFGPAEDYARYPRSLDDDLEMCRRAGVDVVFTPSVKQLYPTGRQVMLSAGPLGTVWEGAARPGHFDGMLTVVSKLLHLVQPHRAIFGQKDAQQLACIRRMVIDLNVDTDIVAAPIVREPDGLAMSSRNRYLSAPDRLKAASISSALHAAVGSPDAGSALEIARQLLDRTGGNLTVDYLAVVNPATLTEVPADYTGEALMIVAAVVGSTRLIDNLALDLHAESQD